MTSNSSIEATTPTLPGYNPTSWLREKELKHAYVNTTYQLMYYRIKDSPGASFYPRMYHAIYPYKAQKAHTQLSSLILFIISATQADPTIQH